MNAKSRARNPKNGHKRAKSDMKNIQAIQAKLKGGQTLN